MKRLLTLILLTVSITLATIVHAEDNEYLKARMWQRHENGIQGVLRCFRNDCQPSEYEEYLFQIVSAETNLIVYGISPKDTRLVSYLATDMKSISDFPVFAYRVFKKRLKELTGFTPEPKGSFEGEIFRIFTKKDSSQRFAVNFQLN